MPTTNRTRRTARLAAGALALAVFGCGDDTGTTAGWTGTIDTLPSGTILVRNPADGGGEGDAGSGDGAPESTLATTATRYMTRQARWSRRIRGT